MAFGANPQSSGAHSNALDPFTQFVRHWVRSFVIDVNGEAR